MFWSIRKACCCTASSPPPMFRGSRRWPRTTGDIVRSVSLSREIVRRQHLSRADLSRCHGRHPAPPRERDHQAIQSGQGLHRPAQALGGQTHHPWLNRCPRLAKDWENLNRIRGGMAFHRSYPTRYEAPRKILLLNVEFRVRLIEADRISWCNWPTQFHCTRCPSRERLLPE